VFLFVFVVFCTSCFAQQKLPAFNADIHESTVSGLSSGGFFAVQMHVAYSSSFMGAAIFAGGPYDCAQGSESMAFEQCMYAFLPPNYKKFVTTTDTRAAAGQLDPTSNLADSHVYMFSGTVDTTVKQTVMDSLYSYYTHYITGTNGLVSYEKTLKAAHTFPTDEAQNLNPCTLSMKPFISNCNYDGAGIALQTLYAHLNPRNNGTLTGQIIEFDQSQFLSNPTSKGLADTGYVFVPVACANGQPCKIHISLHGCEQNYESVKMKYVTNTGFNKWADVNNIVVLYPQTHITEVFPANPAGCWDWWGFDGKNYDINTGTQMQAIYAMLKQSTSNSTSVLTGVK